MQWFKYLSTIFLLWINLNIGSAQSDTQVFTDDGAWCWFSDPRAVFADNKVISGWVKKDGSIELGMLDLQNNSIQKQLIAPQFEVDDHDNPAFAILPDKRILVMYTWHSSKKGVVVQTSLQPLDISAFSDAQVLKPGLDSLLDEFPRETFTYANPYLLAREDNTIYAFGRWIGYKPNMIKSTDLGQTWKGAQVLVSTKPFDPNNRPYVKYASDGESRIHLILTDGHPRVEPLNAVYHCYYENNAFYRSDGTQICTIDQLPFQVEDATKVYEPDSGLGRAWLADLTIDENGNPYILYTRHPQETDHRYHYARYDNKEKLWEDHEICKAGRWFPQTPEGEVEREPHYHGNLTFHPSHPDIIYLSRQIEGRFEIEKRKTEDYGKTWKITPITVLSELDQVRPYVPRNTGKNDQTVVLWMENKKYIHYTNYDTRIKYWIDRDL